MIEFFNSEERLARLVQGLPHAFETVRSEMPKKNPAVGILREHVLTGFFIDEFGEDRVRVPEKGVERSYDLEICGRYLSIKTGTERTKVKVLWTVDPLQIGRELAEYRPFCDIFLVEIFWGRSADSIFYIPVSVQEDVVSEVGENYLAAPVGQNHRGINITTNAMDLLRDHDATIRARVDWVESGLTTKPHDRWLEYWKENK